MSTETPVVVAATTTAAAAAVVPTESKTEIIKSKIEIISLDLHMIHNLEHTHVTEHMCKICKRHIEAPTLEDIQTGNINSKVSLGKCGHSFHTACIDKYMKTGNMSCPIDMTPWNLNKELDQNIMFKKLVHKASDTSPVQQSYVVAKKAAK